MIAAAFPGEPAPHDEERQLGKLLREGPLPRFPFAFDELDHRHFEPAPERAKDDPQRGRGFAFALARINDQKPAMLFTHHDSAVALRKPCEKVGS